MIVSGIALVLSCCLREAVQLTESLKGSAKAPSAEEEEPLIQVCADAKHLHATIFAKFL